MLIYSYNGESARTPYSNHAPVMQETFLNSIYFVGYIPGGHTHFMGSMR
jgi:hypothetical protein